MNKRVHFIDDDPTAGDLFRRFARSKDYEIIIFKNPVEALQDIRENNSNLVITDLSMPGMSGLELLESIRQTDIEVPVIMITGFSTEDNAIKALRLGATDFIKKPYDADELLKQVDQVLQKSEVRKTEKLSRPGIKDKQDQFGMIGRSTALSKIYEIIDKISDIRCNVIIEGESGTGKELVAHALHNHSVFSDQPFIVIDCGSLTDTLLESELFGHEKGAFTGATQTKQGLLEVASGGTIFLDEICNISDTMQMKLMRAVQAQTITRVGGITPINIDVRFVVATNRNIEEMIAAGQFRHDLYHRLNVVKITMPPLREREADLELLIEHFINEFKERYQRDIKNFDKPSMDKLKAYSWPGNIRELRNMIERHIALADGPVLSIDQVLIGNDTGEGIDADSPTLEALEKRYIMKTLDKCNGNKEQTASLLGINKSTLWRKLQNWQKSTDNNETD
ncbi:MAG: sigma-54-dependent Fis family transcriptional regulator [endosymbiont of Galathealinum brachiosum]|uniref:Sigma-54-dependent Fis family transcriptional regulator n=1 Tax=endosymbiont of Galathealinum brachiosum TaxID=2200906 RepID=A0A370DDG7_9GAMM|nr:MAG: sigma-54-dependent Fis family transcriptional regulator [endosymbiont of Galathealinum brachiosum]